MGPKVVSLNGLSLILAFGFRGFVVGILPPIAAAREFSIFAGFEHRGSVRVAEGEDAGEGGLCVGLLLCGRHISKAQGLRSRKLLPNLYP